MHWTVKRKLNEDWMLWVRCKLPDFFCEPIVKMRVRITLHHSRFYDRDNAYGAVKPLVDALARWRLIRNDNNDYLELTVDQDKCPHQQRHTVIELDPS